MLVIFLFMLVHVYRVEWLNLGPQIKCPMERVAAQDQKPMGPLKQGAPLASLDTIGPWSYIVWCPVLCSVVLVPLDPGQQSVSVSHTDEFGRESYSNLTW